MNRIFKLNSKKQKNILIYLVIFLAFVFSLVFIYHTYQSKKIDSNYDVGAVIPVNNDIKPDTLANPFYFEKAKIGDVVSGMEIIKIESLNGEEMPSQDNLKISFKNKKLINGKLNEYTQGPLVGKICLDNYDPYEQKNIPRLINDPRLLFICFNNFDKAKAILEKGNSAVSVYIDNYTINYGPDNSLNYADLVD